MSNIIIEDIRDDNVNNIQIEGLHKIYESEEVKQLKEDKKKLLKIIESLKETNLKLIFEMASLIK
tara:strand:- start:63 stop:257 length:195 start_codon:yes stop_codon:yes gene_type:complete